MTQIVRRLLDRFYYAFIYRRLMVLAHRHGWHHTRTHYPDGDMLLVCHWCGLRYVAERRGYKSAITTEAQTSDIVEKK